MCFFIPSRDGGGGVRGSLEMQRGTGRVNTRDSPTVLVLSVALARTKDGWSPVDVCF
jgi:hypothetical protein